jgi:hypothetical protein
MEAESQRNRLLQALAGQSELTCEQVEAELPRFVAAETAGEDVDADQELAAVAAHLESCERCMARYVALAEDVVGFVEDAAPARPTLAPPTFFGPKAVRSSELVTVRVWQGLVRTVELLLKAPSPAALPTFGGQETLFSDRIPELAGAPALIVTFKTEGQMMRLAVAMRESSPQAHWKIRLRAGEVEEERETDQNGVAVFESLPVQVVPTLEITCTELI